jgi:death-on-curing protein
MEEPIWLEEATVRAIHQRQLAEHGGLGGVREQGGLESALARPRQLFGYGDPAPELAALAACYAGAFVRNHPFVDGNKRVALVAARAFLRRNNWDLRAAPEDKYLAVIGLAAREITEEEFATWIRAHLAPWPSP